MCPDQIITSRNGEAIRMDRTRHGSIGTRPAYPDAPQRADDRRDAASASTHSGTGTGSTSERCLSPFLTKLAFLVSLVHLVYLVYSVYLVHLIR